MKATDDLFLLINSLTKAEKRSFKLLGQSEGKSGKNYKTLFDAIERQPEFNDSYLKKKFVNSPIGKNLPAEKNYLYKAILKSLRNLHSELTVHSRIENSIRNIEILYRKRLIGQCEKQVNKSLDTARLYECYYKIPELIDWQYKIFSRKEDYGSLASYKKSGLSEKEQCFKKAMTLAQVEAITYEVIALDRTLGHGTDTKALKKLSELKDKAHELLRSSRDIFFAEELCYTTLYFISYLTEDYKAAQSYNEQVLELFEQKPHFKEERPGRYYTHLSNLIRRALETRNFKIVEKLIRTVKEFVQQADPLIRTEISPEMVTALFIYELEYLTQSGQIDKAIHLIKSHQKDKELKLVSEEPTLRIIAEVNIALTYFVASMFREAQKITSQILAADYKSYPKDIIEVAYMTRLLASVEQNKPELFEVVHRSAANYFKASERSGKIAALIIDLYAELQESKSSGPLFAAALKQLKAEKILVPKHLEFVRYWLESKVHKKSLPDYLYEN